MTVEDFTTEQVRGYADPTWVRSDGVFVSHPTFTLSEGHLYASNQSGQIADNVFGALITVEENPPVEMAWTEPGFDEAQRRGAYLLESPVQPYLSTQMQAISLRRPYVAHWYSDDDTLTATASSLDHEGYHTGPSGQPWHHMEITSDVSPAPGGPSSDLDGAVFNTVVDPHFNVIFSENLVQIQVTPTAPVATSMHITITCESSDGTFTLVSDEIVLPQSRQYFWSLDDIYRLGEQAGINPDAAVLRVYDSSYLPPALIGTVNPGWTSGPINTYERVDPLVIPTLPASSLDHLVLLDFEQTGSAG